MGHWTPCRSWQSACPPVRPLPPPTPPPPPTDIYILHIRYFKNWTAAVNIHILLTEYRTAGGVMGSRREREREIKWTMWIRMESCGWCANVICINIPIHAITTHFIESIINIPTFILLFRPDPTAISPAKWVHATLLGLASRVISAAEKPFVQAEHYKRK